MSSSATPTNSPATSPPTHSRFRVLRLRLEHRDAVVSLELNRIMKPGGIVMINTHQTWPSHEEPWTISASPNTAAFLFNAATGFEIIAVGHGSPAVMAAALPQPHLQDQNMEWHYGYLASRVVAKNVAIRP